jgi:SAM-dependent methyltransferase
VADLSPAEREEHEEDLISFCDRELDRLGDVRGLRALYAGGTSALWIEGLSQRLGPEGSLAVLDSDPEGLDTACTLLEAADLAAPVRLVAGDVCDPPLPPGSFDLVYSAGLLHELDLSECPTEAALAALATLLRPGGRLATSDFVDTHPALQLEDEALEAELAQARGGEPFGIGPPERLVELHARRLSGVRWAVGEPFPIRHLDRLLLARDDFPERLPPGADAALLDRRRELLQRVRREGYTRPATLYVEGRRRAEP